MKRCLPALALAATIGVLLIACENGSDSEGFSLAPATSTPETEPTPTPTATPTTVTTGPTGTETTTPSATAEETPVASATPSEGTGAVPGLVVDEGLAAELSAFLADDPDVAVVVRRLDDATGAAITPDRSFYTASLFKVFVMYEVYRQRDTGALRLEEELTVTQEWADLALGTSPYATPGQQVTVSAALEAMITLSDNVTANMLADRVGWDSIRSSVVSIGLHSTVLGGGELSTTPADMSRFFQALTCDNCPGLAPETNAEILDLLARQQIRDRLPRDLPEGTRVAHKTGSWNDVTHDAGIVFSPAGSYIIVVMVARGSGHGEIAEISRLVYDYYNP
ncbi:MAG: hypothetical protein GEU28_12810 [Dehalococcoidia bacterium]|nr:hypothetical protein [Dehalococcoidia bacterium]